MAQNAPFHLAAWFENLDVAGVQQNLAAVADQSLDVQGDNIRVPPELLHIGGAYLGASTFTANDRGVFSSPTLQGRQLLDIQPLSVTTEPGSPPCFMSMFDYPVPLTRGEILNLQALDTPGGATDYYGLAWLTRGALGRTSPPVGAIWARFLTVASAVVAGVWNGRQLAADRNLPDGNYTIYGMRAQGTTLVGARLIIPGSDYRPGTLGSDLPTDATTSVQDIMSHLGPWGTFRSEALPRVELLCTAADNEVQEVDLLIAKG